MIPVLAAVIPVQTDLLPPGAIVPVGLIIGAVIFVIRALFSNR